jgi:hypothetical protein
LHVRGNEKWTYVASVTPTLSPPKQQGIISFVNFATICIIVEGSGLSGEKAGGYLKQAQNSSAQNPPSQTSALVIHSLFQRKGSAYLILAIDIRRGKELTLDPHTANNLPAGARCKELSRPRTSRQYR